MKAAVTWAPQQMELRSVPAVEPAPNEAVISVRVVGLCGSDIHLFKGAHPYSRFPTVQGHEFSGVVKQLGAAYAGELRLGDVVVVEPLKPCGKCIACRRGHRNCCTSLAVLGAHVDGALTEEIAVDASSCYSVGPLDLETAALVEPVSIGLQAVVRSGTTPDDTVLVIGAGPIGQAAILAAHNTGARVMAVDLLDNRLALARHMGAEHTANTSTEALQGSVAEWTDGEGPTVIVEATGVGYLVRAAVDLVAPAGTVVVVGISNDEVPLSVATFTRKEINVLGSRNNRNLFGDAVRLVQAHRDQVRELITHRFPFDSAPEAMMFAMTHPHEAEKVLVIMQEEQ